MKRRRFFMLPVLLFLPIVIFSDKISDQNLLNQIMSNPSRHIENFTFDRNSELLSRVQTPPDFVIKDWRRWDKRDDYIPYYPTPEERTIISNSLGKLPPLYKKVFKKRLAGIYFIKNLMGSGLTTYIFDNKYNVFVYMAFNPEVLKKDISEWITIKENTCFRKNDQKTAVKIDCGHDYQGFMYILLHEGTHAVDFVKKFTPYADQFMQKIPGYKYKESKFIKGVWTAYNVMDNLVYFPYHDNVTFYGMNNGPKLMISEAGYIYKSLLKTPFVSLYGTKSWAEDMAEYATFYYLTEVLKQPYKISVFQNDQESVFEPLMSEVAMKRKEIVKSILK